MTDVKTTYFVSGHLDLTQKEFDEHYLPIIKEAMANNDNFVVGDAKGADSLAQKFLVGYPKVTVYHMFDAPRNNVGSFATIGGFKSDQERDEAMTLSSSEDIAWVRKGREKSGTAKNLKRRNNAR